MIDAGSTGLCILANFSEQFVLSDEEREDADRGHPQARGGPRAGDRDHHTLRHPVCAERSRRAQDLGAAMVMVMPPYHGATIRVAEEKIYEFFATLSAAIDIPIMIQDAPVSGTPLSATFLARMAKEIRNVAYFKIETPGRGLQAARADTPGRRRDRRPWDGEEAITLLPDLEAGATGAMTGGGYPDGIRRIMDAWAAGHREEAAAEYTRWLPLINYENRQGGMLTAQGADEGRRHDRAAGEAPRHPVSPPCTPGLLLVRAGLLAETAAAA
jgi:dihydrodipicolinate synthase/N-acetylneuraminate lyase